MTTKPKDNFFHLLVGLCGGAGTGLRVPSSCGRAGTDDLFASEDLFAWPDCFLGACMGGGLLRTGSSSSSSVAELRAPSSVVEL